MNKLTKFVSVALTATTILSTVGVAFLAPVANAQSTSDLQAQIAALLAQIQQLQSKLGSGSSSGSSMSYSFTRDLTVGSKGADVTALQQMLAAKGYLSAAATGYFGALTKAAVAKWQAAVGLSPAAGYFGAKSRAFVASMAVSPSPSPSPSGSPTPAPNAPASGLSVAVSAQNPVAGSLISSASSAAARVPVFAVQFTAGNSGAATVTELKFHKTGVISDSSISGAYLVQNGRVVAQYNSIAQGVIDFSGLNWQVPAGQTATLWLAIDPATGLNAGNTTGFSLLSTSDVSAVDTNGTAIVASGSFPLVGGTFTITTVTNPAIASLTIASTSIATTVTAGTTNNIVGAWNFTGSNSKVWLNGIKFVMIGSANKGDLKNLKLYVNGVQVGSTLPSVAADGTAYFDLSSNPGALNTSSNNVQLYADVMGSPSYNFQFEILNSYDVYAVDSQYNVPIAAQSNVGTQVSIQSGTVTVSQASNTPTGNLAPGQSAVTIAKFTVYAAGEAVKIKYLDFKLTFGTAPTSTPNAVKNVALTDDAGGQIGTTINTPPTGAACQGGTAALAGAVYNDCFGTPNSNVNYIVPANTTRVLSLKADIQSLAAFNSVIGSLSGNTSNLQGLTSSATGGTGSAQGAALTLSTTQLTVAQNTSLGNQTVSKNSTNVKVGSYALSASSADGITISTISIKTGASGGTNFQNLKVMVGGTQFGITQGLVSNSQTYSFSGTPFTIPKGGTTYVDIYADVLSGLASDSPATILQGLSGTGVTSFNAVSLATPVNGQGITAAGQSAITVTADSATSAAAQLVMGSTGNSLAAFRFTETSNVENVKITDLNVFDNVLSTSAVKSGFANVSLYNGSTLVGTAGSALQSANATSGTGGYLYQFHFATPVVVPQANSITLTLKGDVSSYSSSGATDNTSHTFKIATTALDSINSTSSLVVVALGNSSNATSSVTLTSANGNGQTLLRSKLTATAAALGTTSGRVKNTSDDLATITFSADAAGAAALNSVTVTFTGSAVSATSSAGISLIDANNVNVVTSQGASVTSSSVAGNTTVTWTFGANGFQISGGTSYSFKVRLNSITNTNVAASNSSVSLGVTVQANTDVGYSDGLDVAATHALALPATAAPLNVTSITYSSGT